MTWESGALNYLAHKGYDPAYGARPLKRLIQQEVETALSRKMIKGEIQPGDEVILKAAGDVLMVEKVE
jgi:ATP-dependent Clp protease ATP-binding subunit ClpB